MTSAGGKVEGEPVERLVLVGFMASGKTTVGRLVADRLGWKHIDFDAVIEQEMGARVAEIFDRQGEAAFRRAEAELTKRLASLENVVLTPGGGWSTNPGLPALMPARTLTVWLKVSSEEVVRRLQEGAGAADRPLLRDSPDHERVSGLLSRREPLYGRADLTIDTTGRTPHQVADELATLMSSSG